jgi:ABC-2 type transport system permease protein
MILECKLLLKQRAVWLMLVYSLLLTFLSLYNGWRNITHIRHEIQHAQHEEQVRKQSQINTYTQHGDAGEVGYYVFHNVYQHPADWSFIALGNRMVTPYVQRVRLLGLQGQLYDGESHHPEYVMIGSFDYAFWLIFFAPLLCIALMHDLKASEHQAQRLVFLSSLLNHTSRFWLKRIAVRWLIVSISLCLPLIAFSLMHALPVSPLLIILGITLGYTLCWTLICALVSLRSKALNASFNAMVLASVWILICMVLPNVAQAWVHYQYPVQDGSDIALQHRQLVHSAWDLPKEATLQPFYKLYPQWENTPPVENRFHWKWYFAFQHMADVKLSTFVQQREQALLDRHTASEKIAIILPSVWVQQKLENIAESDVTHLLNYRHKINEFHTKIRDYIYPYLFEEKPFTNNDFANMPTFKSNHQ